MPQTRLTKQLLPIGAKYVAAYSFTRCTTYMHRYPHLDFTLAWLLYDELLAVGAKEAAERIALEHSQ
jgi:hypothetical protein